MCKGKQKIPTLPWSSLQIRRQKPRLLERKKTTVISHVQQQEIWWRAVGSLTYCQNPDSAQTSVTAGRCRSSGSEVCTCLEQRGNTEWNLFCSVTCCASSQKNEHELTCSQDELAVLGHLDWGGHSWHFKVLDELNPALDVWRGMLCLVFSCHQII